VPGRKQDSGKRAKARPKALAALASEDVIVPAGWGTERLPTRVPVLIAGEPLSEAIIADRR
jgi:hypothetical protein